MTIDWLLNFWGDFVVSTEMGWELLGVLGWVGFFFVSKSNKDELRMTENFHMKSVISQNKKRRYLPRLENEKSSSKAQTPSDQKCKGST